MKKLLTLLTITTLGLLILPVTVSAADEKPNAEAAKGEARGARRDRLEMMKENLSLTPDQVEKIKPILEGERAKLKEVREDNSLAQDAKRAKVREMMKESAEKIKPILTPEQQAKWQEAQAKRRANAGNAGNPGNAEKK